MSVQLLTVITVLCFFVLLASGFPVAFCLLGLSMIFTAIFIGPMQVQLVYNSAFNVMTTEIYIAIPLFIFMAATLQNSGIGPSMFDMMYKWFGGLRGGLAIGSVVVATLIAAMTGLGGTDVVIMGILAYPEMMRRGYNKLIAIGCIPAGGALGPLIPPSVVMIILAGFASLSVGKLFMGGLFPGLLMSFLFVIYIAIRCWRQPHLAPALPVEERATWREKFISLRGVIFPILLILLVLGTIYTGIATPTEAAGVGAFGTLIIAAIYKQLNWKNIKESTFLSIRVTAMIYWLVIGGNFFAAYMTMTGVSKFISDSIATLPFHPLAVVAIMQVLVLILGTLMDSSAIIMITIPIFMPVVYHIGVDPLWFSLVYTINLIIGYISPPFGINLFYTKGILPPDVGMGDIYRSVMPYCGLMLIVLIVAFFWPPLVVWLPNTMIK